MLYIQLYIVPLLKGVYMNSISNISFGNVYLIKLQNNEKKVFLESLANQRPENYPVAVGENKNSKNELMLLTGNDAVDYKMLTMAATTNALNSIEKGGKTVDNIPQVISQSYKDKAINIDLTPNRIDYKI